MRQQIPELFQIAEQVKRREIVGIAACKPPNSHPGKEARVFDFVGMLGLPLVPCHEFPASAPAAFFSIHIVKTPGWQDKLSAFIQSGKPVLLTDGLVAALAGRIPLNAPNVHVLKVNGDPQSLLQLSQAKLDELRASMLQPFKTTFRAPNRVAPYLFKDGSWVVENFNDQPVQVELAGKTFSVDGRGWKYDWR